MNSKVWIFAFTVFAMLSQIQVKEVAGAQALVQKDSLKYLGAFRVPQGDLGGPRYHGFSYGGTAPAYNAANRSLYLIGTVTDQLVAEITVPTPVISPVLGNLSTARVLQNLSDVTEGARRNIKVGGTTETSNNVYIGGLLVSGNNLVGTVYNYYDGGSEAYLSHFKSGKALAAAGDFAGMYRLDPIPQAGFVAGYMSPIPAEYQSSLGGSAITGQANLSIISRTSFGPSAFAFYPERLGIENPLKAVPLVYYPIANQALGEWRRGVANEYVAMEDKINGVVFPEKASSILFFGRHGSTSCYGIGTSKASQAASESEIKSAIAATGASYVCGNSTISLQDATGGDACCYDPADSSKGGHSYPYNYYVWAYDVNDLIAVKNGSKQPWEIKPYSVWSFDLPFQSESRLIQGVAFDPATNRIFLSQGFGDNAPSYGLPVIHVFQIQTQSGQTRPASNLKGTLIK